MTKSFTNGGPLTCDEMTQFVDVEFFQALSVEKQRDVKAHLQRCVRCAEFVRIAYNMKRFPDALSKEELDFAVHCVLTKSRREGRTTARKFSVQRAVAVAASIAAVLLVGGIFAMRASSPGAVPDGFRCTPTVPTRPIAGVLLTFCDSHPPPETVVERGGVLRVSFRHGAVGLRVDPNRPNKRDVIVETGAGEVLVKGTVFTVRATPQTSWVEVFRGAVEVVPGEGSVAPFQVSQGYGAAMSTGDSFALTAPRTEVLRDRLREIPSGVERAQSGAFQDTDASFDTVEMPVSTEPVAEPVRSAAAHAKGSVDAMFHLIQEAQSCLIERDWACAAAQYRTVLTRYPRRPESAAVLISLAKVELRYLNAPRDALTHYRRYQLRAPNGPLSEEAQFGKAEALQRLGRTEEAAAALRLFIERFPESSLVRKARARLARLVGGNG